MKGKKRQDWKPSPVDYSSLSAQDLESFGGIEELTDYEIIKAEKGKTFRVIKSGRVKKKKIKKKKGKGSSNEEGQEKKEPEKIDMSAWCNSFVPEEILRALQELGFQKPTEIQELTLPPAIRDHLDILAAAETGSGKTLAFGIPIISHIIATKQREAAKNENAKATLRGLILLPTRELAIQVKNHLRAITKYVDVKIITIVGGMSQEKQQRLLQKSPDIIVATPGRLWQLMEEERVEYLKQIPYVRYFVIDEADRMVEQGHFEELTKILELMNSNKKDKRRQNFIFSATLTMVHEMPKRLDLKKKKIKKDKLESLMKLIGVSEKPKIIDITQKSGVVRTLTESQIMCTMEEKDVYLYYFIVMYPGRTLVFCNSINCVRRLKSVLENLGCHPLALHASMHQRQRLKNLDTFAGSERGLLLATDVAARGLDIKGIEHIVHFQVPRTAEIYVHRSGRTARAQNEGLSLVLMEHQEAVFWTRICKTLSKDKALPVFPVDLSILKVIKERVNLARQIDQQEHRIKRLGAQNRWFLKAAEDMDIDLDDDDNKDLLNDMSNTADEAAQRKTLKAMKKALSTLLGKEIIPKKLMSSYITKSGKLLLPKCNNGTEKAVDVLRLSQPKKKKK